MVKDEIQNAIKEFTDAYCNKDFSKVRSCQLNDKQVMLIGSGADELYFSLDDLKRACERDWSQADIQDIEISDLTVESEYDSAWCFCNAVFKLQIDKKPLDIKYRWTLVFIKREGKWKMAQSHLSVPATDQPEGSSFSI